MGLVLCVGGEALGDPPTGTETAASAGSASSDAQTPVSTGSFLSSVKQAFRQDLNYEVVRGHFDVGSPPNTHRFYCLVDSRTGQSETHGVAGQPVSRPDGMTGIKAGAVSPLSCAKAEQQGILVTTGYALSVASKATINPPSPAQRPSGELGKNSVMPDKIDVAGVKLGMSPDQVRAVLRSKMLSDYYESTETLVNFDSTKRTMNSIASGRFVNVIAAWTPVPSSPAGDAVGEEGESYEVMFTPVPGRERAMAIVHSVAYSTANAIGAMAFQNGLVTKYGGYSGPNELPESSTWRIQSGGNVLIGDPCNRREIFGGLGEIDLGTSTQPNLALKTTPEEFRIQIDRCGAAIVTEDHSTPNSDAPPQDRIITRFTVTAYSPSIAFDGATMAAQLIQTAGNAVAKPQTAHVKDVPVPNL